MKVSHRNPQRERGNHDSKRERATKSPQDPRSHFGLRDAGPCEPTSRGFTLLEVLLAVGISVLAMAAVYAAMGIHLRFIEAGDSDVERAQLARAVLGRIAEDLRATVYHSSTSGATESSSSETNSDSQADEDAANQSDTAGSDSEDAANDDEGLLTIETGLFGGPNALTLYVDRVARTLDYSLTNAAAGPAGMRGLQLVSYYLAPRPASDESQSGGLVRDEAGPLFTSVEDLDFAADVLPPGAQVMAPEVSLLEFRYFDGFEWFDSWDSDFDGALPQAVEIALGFTLEPGSTQQAQALEQERLAAQTAGRPWPPVHRLVVALPTASPPLLTGTDEEGLSP